LPRAANSSCFIRSHSWGEFGFRGIMAQKRVLCNGPSD